MPDVETDNYAVRLVFRDCVVRVYADGEVVIDPPGKPVKAFSKVPAMLEAAEHTGYTLGYAQAGDDLAATIAKSEKLDDGWKQER
jgi:hypothetical protein